MLEPPRAMPTTTSSVQRNHAYNRAASSCALDAILSQLAFYSEPPAPPVPQTNEYYSCLNNVGKNPCGAGNANTVSNSSKNNHNNNNHNNNLSQPESPPFWRRLFCTSSLEVQDLYFDALEIIDDRKEEDDDYLIAKSKLDSIWILRGGGGDQSGNCYGNNNGNNHWCNNFNGKNHHENNSYRTESPTSSSGSDDSFRSLPTAPTPSLHEYCEAQLIEPYGRNGSNNSTGGGSGGGSYYNNQQTTTNNDYYNNNNDKENYYQQQQQNRQSNVDDGYSKLPAPLPPKELPTRFLRAGKNDPIEGQRRYEATLQWRKDFNMDSILTEPHPNFNLIKKVRIRENSHTISLKSRMKGSICFYLFFASGLSPITFVCCCCCFTS